MRWIAKCMLPLVLAPVVVAQYPLAGYPVVEIRGRVEGVHLNPGAGMPYLTVNDLGSVTKVRLGSMRYLIAQGFSPKVGEAIDVRAYKLADELVAITVTLPEQNKTLRLRDETGRPAWRGGKSMPGPMACPMLSPGR